MTTRHVAADTDYPFVPVLSDADSLIVGGILDLVFTIQGPPTDIGTSSSSTSSSSEPDQPSVLTRDVYLIHYAVQIMNTVFSFRAVELGDPNKTWDITFTVPNNTDPGKIAMATNDDGGDSRAVLIYSSDKVIAATGDCMIRVEPGRSQFYTEAVTALSFWNIARCAGVEDSSSSVEVLTTGSSSATSLNWEDGYNTVVSYENSLLLTGGVGLGLGVVPDVGNTVVCEESSTSAESLEFDDYVSVVNGILPDGTGDLPIVRSNSIGVKRTRGRLELLIRNQ